ncbi:DUF5916 domain-containing protein [Aequorivita echinoideorum]|uniref:DUF5916 domain-containing protein n=1 Tax=Aequorivita echinoideorum TaxID=1549647 RepID=UPI001FE7A81C|nr:DUF5916 domain-containing protein [Aequorivita echinoideorum]
MKLLSKNIRATQKSFKNNFRNLFDEPQLNSISLRISYFLDYNRVKRWFSPSQKNFNTTTRLGISEKMILGQFSGRNIHS